MKYKLKVFFTLHPTRARIRSDRCIPFLVALAILRSTQQVSQVEGHNICWNHLRLFLLIALDNSEMNSCFKYSSAFGISSLYFSSSLHFWFFAKMQGKGAHAWLPPVPEQIAVYLVSAIRGISANEMHRTISLENSSQSFASTAVVSNKWPQF
jgi:hypothetical protein